MQVSRLLLSVTATLMLVGGLSACGEHGEANVGKNEGYYVETGGLQYQVQISRQLNPKDFEDRDYLIGLPSDWARASSTSPSSCGRSTVRRSRLVQRPSTT